MKRNETLRHALKEQGVFGYEVAERMGVNESTFYRWLHSALSPNKEAEILKHIAEIAKEKH